MRERERLPLQVKLLTLKFKIEHFYKVHKIIGENLFAAFMRLFVD